MLQLTSGIIRGSLYIKMQNFYNWFMCIHLIDLQVCIRRMLVCLFPILLFAGCDFRDNSSQQEGDVVGNPNEFDNQLTEYEHEDRVIWQKPGLILDLLQPLEDKIVADLGAGSGYFAFRMLDKADRVIALDIDPLAIQFMDSIANTLDLESKSRFETRMVKHDDPMLAEKEVDIILLVNTYTYIEDRVSYFKRLKRSLKDYGKVLIIDFKKKSLPIGPPTDQKLDQYLVEQELRSAGYQVLVSDDRLLDYQYIIKAVKLDDE